MTSEATHHPPGPQRADSPGADSSQAPGAGTDAPGRVEVRIVSGDPEAARRVADALRVLFAGDEQRSYPDGPAGTGTRLHLTLDASDTARPLRPWLDTSRPPADRTHRGETV
ncbi:hypothetical protein [Streptomyces sp. NPDC006333]|uniref:hypothetical protein n=1 Tax=unclassified Streptomyces TaxID=2593676 RepID=UPI0033B35FF8